ncbi:uncharacterized protein LOC133519912 isoform X2 [Cydia pomonella]|uniref:uncharacterized protein LOC133519912 isoform X2 n=1 Tax=Cydia pomonella TaxID=82600 RepID=UPI002ADE73BF|nr:uncharacterized protein LOC133519912 isoform X2 [Cydia pomonella]
MSTYSVIQFSDQDGGSISIVKNQWITPRRREVFWPPVKGSKAFEKVLADTKTPDEKWKRYAIQRVFCETDDIDKAKRKLKLVEETSDLQTEAEEEPNFKRKRNNRYISTSDEDDGHIRPPPIKKKFFNKTAAAAYYRDTRQAQPNITQDSPSTPEKTLSLLNVVDGLPVLTNSVLQDLTEDGEGRLTPVSRIRSPWSRNQQLPNLGSDVPATPSCGQGLKGLQDTVVSLLAHIKAQNDIIISILREKHTRLDLKPEFKFPIKTSEELEIVEKLLTSQENHANVVAYFKSLGGQGVNNKVSRVMKVAMSDSMASKYNFYGKRSDKKPFAELRLRACVVESLKSATTTEKDIEDGIKVWLKHAPERTKKALDNSVHQNGIQ